MNQFQGDSSNLASSESIRAIAMSAGDLSATVRREVRAVLKESKRNQNAAIKSGIRQLAGRGLISSHEAKRLSKACNLFFLMTTDTANNTNNSALAIREIYQDMIADADTSPTAIAIASLVNGAFTISDGASSPVAQQEEGNVVMMASITITPESTGAGAIAGGVIGGVIGGIVGGALGAGLGAAIGGAAGAAIGLCNEEGV